MKDFDLDEIPVAAAAALVVIALFMWSKKRREREAMIGRKSGNKKYAKNWA